MSSSGVNGSDALRIVDVLQTISASWRVIAVCTVGCFSLAIAAAAIMKPVYRAETLLSYNDARSSGLDLSGLTSQFGGLASLAGVNLSSSKDEKSVALALITSRAFLEMFIQDHGLLPVLFADRWDAGKKGWRTDKPPTLYNGVDRLRKTILNVNEDRRTGLVRLSVEWRDREVAAAWANDLVRRANHVTREWAIADARESQKYLQAELDRTNVVELRQSINRLLEGELKKEMIASVRVQYSFRVIDPAKPADEDDFVRPKRMVLVLFGLVSGIMSGIVIALILHAWRVQRRAGRAA